MENLSLTDTHPPDPDTPETNGEHQSEPQPNSTDRDVPPPTQSDETVNTTTENVATEEHHDTTPKPPETTTTEKRVDPEPVKVDPASKNKIDVLLKAAGDAPIMKKKKWAVDGNKPVAYLTQFIKKYIKCEPHESLFLYVNQTFCPSQDQVLSNLFECFGSDGKLILHYCKTQAWG